MNYKGQGALEYLLLIGGAVLIAAIVITLVISTGRSGADEATLKSGEALCLTNSGPTAATCDATNLPASLTTGTNTYECELRIPDDLCKLCNEAATAGTDCQGAAVPAFVYP